MSRRLEDRIKGAKLTKVEQLIANYFLEHRESLYFMTSKDIARELHVSDTSVIRLCRTLGYNGFRELQRLLQMDLAATLDQQKYILPYQKIAEKRVDSKEMDMGDLLELSLRNLQNTYAKNPPASIRQAVEDILSSQHIFVGGFRGSAPAAGLLGTYLSQYTSHVEYSTRADSSCIETLLDYGEEDCVILIGTERYSKMARTLADMARESRSKLIAIVDKVTSPIAYQADVVLQADITSPTAFNSYLGIFFLIEAISFELSRYAGLYTQARLERLNSYLSKLELY